MTINRNYLIGFAVVSIVVIAGIIFAMMHQTNVDATSDYVNLQFTDIRGLSLEQIEGYQTGAGMGFALPAELNGYPGPRHVLDMADDLELTDEQEADIQALYDEMLPQAIELGEQILAQEESLELTFREETVTETVLEEALTEVGRLESDLRYVHLSTHLATIEILTEHQVQQYNILRGYEAESDHSEHSGH